MKRSATDYRKGTKRHMIAELADRGASKRQAFLELRPLVESGIRPMVFSANDPISHSRVPKPMHEQLIELKNEIGRVYAILGRSVSSDFDSPDIAPVEPDADATDADTSTSTEPDTSTDTDDSSPEPDAEPVAIEDAKPVASGKVKLEQSLRFFLKRVREIRAFCEDRARLSEIVDEISMRPVQAGARLIRAGVPVEALLYAMCMHWPNDSRRDAGVTDFDFVKFSRTVMSERGITEIVRSSGKVETPHMLFGYALILAENRQPIMLVGPAGTGKSHLAAQLADYLELQYGETPMSPGATRGDLLGRHTISGYISAQFVELYGKGGVFNFEEIDASDASMLIVLNNALASDKLFNSSNGEMIEKHENFIAISTANTFGLGANRQYTARERLDAATIDRWRMGRIFVSLDESVEESILGL